MAKTYLEQTEIEALENAATCSRDRLFITVLHRVGCRVTEGTQIEVPDIDFDRRILRIEHLKTRLLASCSSCGARLGRKHSFCPSCGERVAALVTKAKERRKMRELPLDDEMLRSLREYIDSGGPIKRNGKTLLFGFGRHRGWQIVRDCARRAGIQDLVNPETGRSRGISPHRLRDAFATNAMKTDSSVEGTRMLQQQLGHQSFDTTARYRKISDDEHRRWYQQLWDRAHKSEN